MQNKTNSPSSLREFDGLDIRITHILIRNGILTLEDLISKKETELLMFRNMGQDRVTLVRKWLNEKGLDLKPEFSSFSIKLSDCKGLYLPTARILMSNGISTLENLLSKTDEEIIQIEGITPRHLSIIKQWLKKYHLSNPSN